MNHSNKYQQGFSIVELLIIMLVLGLIVWAGLYMYRASTKVVKTGGSSNSQQSVIDDVAAQVPAMYSFASVNTAPWVAQLGVGASLAEDGFTFNISTQNFSSVYFGEKDSIKVNPQTSEFNDNVNKIIGNALWTHGFQVSKDTYALSNNYDDYTKLTQIPKYIAYTSSTARCLLIYFTEYPATTLSCFSKSDVATAFTNASAYVNTYIKANPSIAASTVTFGPAVVKSHYGVGVIGSSHEAGYDISEVVFTVNNTKKMALFYNHLNGPWIYVTQADDEFGFRCSTYTANATVRKVMHDQICLSSNGQVRLDTDARALQ